MVAISVVNAFPSVNVLLQVFTHFKNRGIKFISLHDKYLMFQDGKELKIEYVNYLQTSGYDEQQMINNIYSLYNRS